MKQAIHCNHDDMVTHLRNMADEHWHAAEGFSPRGARASNERGIAAGLDAAADIIEAWAVPGEIAEAAAAAGWLPGHYGGTL
jgi:hypothetical protein